MSSTYETVKVEHENGIAWVILNRPDKRNAMSPQLHYDMCEVLDELEQGRSSWTKRPIGPASSLTAGPRRKHRSRSGGGHAPSRHGRRACVVRQLNDMKTGARSGISTALMRAVVEKLSVEDMVAIAAYLGARDP